MIDELLISMIRYIIQDIHLIPASAADIDHVATQMRILYSGKTKLGKLDFSTVETAGVAQIGE